MPPSEKPGSISPPTAPETTPETAASLSPQEANDIPWLLGYARAIHGGSAETLAQEYRQAEQALRDTPTARNQLRMALILSLPDTRYHNPTRAQALLDKYLATLPAQEQMLQNLAYLLRIQVGEVVHQEETVRRIMQRLDKLEAENKTLHEQLDALKEIERTLDQRQKGPSTDTR